MKYRLDCAKSDWKDVSHHFRCNLLVECFGAEDEEHCLYNNVNCQNNIDCPKCQNNSNLNCPSACPKGQISAGGSCYIFLASVGSSPSIETSMSWNETFHLCESLGGRLPVLNTPKKWYSVTSLFQYRSVDRINIGLRSAKGALPQL